MNRCPRICHHLVDVSTGNRTCALSSRPASYSPTRWTRIRSTPRFLPYGGFTKAVPSHSFVRQLSSFVQCTTAGTFHGGPGSEHGSKVNGPITSWESPKIHLGVSLVPVFDGKSIEREAIYWEHERNCAIRKGKWKEAEFRFATCFLIFPCGSIDICF